MTTTPIRQYAALNGYRRRSEKLHPLVLRDQSPLPPRAIFDGHPEVLEAYDELERLNGAARENYRQAREKRTAAEQARQGYKAAVGRAMESGEDPALVQLPNDAQLDAEADQHLKFADQAAGRAKRQGAVLGDAIQPVAPALFANAEESLRSAEGELSAALTDLEGVLTRWAGAWALRRWLSDAAYVGGGLAWHGAEVPADKREALAVLSATTDDLDRLKHDEAEVGAFRAANGGAA